MLGAGHKVESLDQPAEDHQHLRLGQRFSQADPLAYFEQELVNLESANKE